MDKNKCLDIFFALLTSQLTGGNKVSLDGITEEEIGYIFSLAKDHELLPIVLSAVSHSDSRFAKSSAVKDGIYKAIGIHERKLAAKDTIVGILEAEKIDYILLKGSAISSLYPVYWWRTFGDIDILIKREDVLRATDALKRKSDFLITVSGYKDIQILYCSNEKIELHLSLSGINGNKASCVLDRVWDYSVRKNKDVSEHVLNDEMLFFYHLSHMASHFQNGGCGIRFFCDYYLLLKNKDCDFNKLNEMLRQAGLEKFADCVLRICNMWFEGKNDDGVKETAEYIISTGNFGTRKTFLGTKCSQKGTFRYVLSRIFISHAELCELYPSLKEKKYQAPVFRIKYLGSVFFDRNRFARAAKDYLKINKNDKNKIKRILDTVGL